MSNGEGFKRFYIASFEVPFEEVREIQLIKRGLGISAPTSSQKFVRITRISDPVALKEKLEPLIADARSGKRQKSESDLLAEILQAEEDNGFRYCPYCDKVVPTIRTSPSTKKGSSRFLFLFSPRNILYFSFLPLLLGLLPLLLLIGIPVAYVYIFVFFGERQYKKVSCPDCGTATLKIPEQLRNKRLISEVDIPQMKGDNLRKYIATAQKEFNVRYCPYCDRMVVAKRGEPSLNVFFPLLFLMGIGLLYPIYWLLAPKIYCPRCHTETLEKAFNKKES